MDNIAIYNFVSDLLKEYSNLDAMMTKMKDWYSKNFKAETQTIFVHNMTKAIRLIYQEMLLVKV